MSTVAIVGAGPIGAAIAHRLAERSRVRAILLIDEGASVAAGKALDIRQSGPIAKSDVALNGSGDLLAAAGASVVVLADDTAGGEWEGERGLAAVQRLVRAGTAAALVFAGSRQVPLMEMVARELKVARDRLIGTAASGVVSSVAALTAIELGRTGVNVTVSGRPPALVIGWTAATVGGALVTDLVPAHRLLAISNALPRLWPPGPQTIAASTALIIEALIAGSRRLHPAMTILDGEFGVRNRAALLPLELGRGRLLAHVVPSLSPQERTEMISGLTQQRSG